MGWDKEKLEALRAKYGEGHGGELFDPRFRRVADKIFSKSGTRLAPYSGVPTFLSAPYRQIDPAAPDFGDLQVALLGVPMDLGVTNRPGARFGPRRCERSSASVRIITCSTALPYSTYRSPISGMFRSQADIDWSNATRISNGTCERL